MCRQAHQSPWPCSWRASASFAWSRCVSLPNALEAMAHYDTVRVLCHVAVRRWRLLQLIFERHRLLQRRTPRKRSHIAGAHTPRRVAQRSSEASTEHGHKERCNARAHRPTRVRSSTSLRCTHYRIPHPTRGLAAWAMGAPSPSRPCDPRGRTVRVTLGRRGVPAPRRAARWQFAVLRRHGLQSFTAHAQQGMAA